MHKMKKYTILSSDTEEDKMNESYKPHCNGYKPGTSAVTPVQTFRQSGEVKFGTTHNENQLSSQKKEKKIESLVWDNVRTPSIKSDEEISYWITTAKAPCLYHCDNDINNSFTSSSNILFAHNLDEGNNYLKEKPLPKKATCILNGRSYEVPTYIPSNRLKTDLIDIDNQVKRSMDVKESLLAESNRLNSNRLKRSLEDNSLDDVKCKMSRTAQPIDDYDSGSSVLTVNYIKYVNKQADNIKQSKLKRKPFPSSMNSLDSINKLNKQPGSLGRDSGCVLQDKDSNLCQSQSKVKPVREKSSRSKKSYNIENTSKSSFEATKKINETIFDNTKHSSSIEDSFNSNNKNNSKQLSKWSLQSEIPNSVNGSFINQPTDCVNLSNPLSQVIYTKIETVQYISDSSSSNNQSSFRTQPNPLESFCSLKTEEVFHITQGCGYSDF